MTDEQNKPVRSRDEHAAALTVAILMIAEKPEDYRDEDFKKKLSQAALDTVLEAEARGAAEQRRKDGEGQQIAGWRFRVEMCVSGKYTPWVMTDEDPSPWIKASGCHDRYQVEALHTHPANVAALEGRIAELEGAITALFDGQCVLENRGWDEKPDRIVLYDDEQMEAGKDPVSVAVRGASNVRATLKCEGGV